MGFIKEALGMVGDAATGGLASGVGSFISVGLRSQDMMVRNLFILPLVMFIHCLVIKGLLVM